MQTAQVHIYTDGAARGNPGPGGYGIVMEWVGKSYRKEFAKGFKHTTNNRMELLAVIDALKKFNDIFGIGSRAGSKDNYFFL